MRWPSFQLGMRDAGLLPGVWFTVGSNAAQTPQNAGFVVVEVEGDSDRHGLVSVLDTVPDIPRAILTNFHGLIVKDSSGATDYAASRARAEPLISGGWECLTEVYQSDNPSVTPASMDFIATKQLGFERTFPVYGVYGGRTLESYTSQFAWPGYGVYLAEYL